MIIYKHNKGYETRSDKPNENWTNEDVYVVEDGTDLATKIKEYAPHFNFVIENGELLDIIPTEKPPETSIPQLPTTEDRITELENMIIMMMEVM